MIRSRDVSFYQKVSGAERSVPPNTFRLTFRVLVAWSSDRGDQWCIRFMLLWGVFPAPT